MGASPAASDTTFDEEDFQFSSYLRQSQVWYAVCLLCLLEDCNTRDTTLELSDADTQDERLRQPMRARNVRLQQLGLGQILHRCKKCIRFFDKRGQDEGMCKSIPCYGGMCW